MGTVVLSVIGGAVCLLAVLIIVWLASCYNRLVRQRNQVDAAWAQIDVQLKRRYDLIPNLVETVRGYAAHERGTLDAVIQARNSAVNAAGTPPANRAMAENALTQTLGRLFALAEAYPNLQANQNFLGLQSELANTEDKIAYARQFYNTNVLSYNTKTQTFPSVIFANMFGFQPAEFFEAEEAAREDVHVSFTPTPPAATP